MESLRAEVINKCSKCDRTFGSIKALKTHIDKVKCKPVGYVPTHECHICKRQFTRKNCLKRHLASQHVPDKVNKPNKMHSHIKCILCFNEEVFM